MNYVIIVAGGKGLRMGADVPKQFLLLGGKPVLMRTMERFYDFDAQLKTILVLPRDQQTYWHELCRAHDFNLPYLLADGGATRFESVSNGLALIPNDAQGVVAVHDGVRPSQSRNPRNARGRNVAPNDARWHQPNCEPRRLPTGADTANL